MIVMKKILTLMLLSVIFTACEKEHDQGIKYLITGNSSGFIVNYRDAAGNVINKTVIVASAEDQWTYSYNAEEGEIVFVSAIYKDINSSIKIQILIDGKVYKQGSSKYDTINYVTVSGTVPFE